MERREFLKYLLASGVAAGTGVSGLLSGCDRKEDSQNSKGVLGKPNILLITADTLRADYLRCYGHSTIHTPSIDLLADQGVLFRNCFCQSTSTNPSHSSIFTSLYSKDHQVYSNSDYLAQNVRVISEELRDTGYDTGGVVSAAHLNPDVSGFGRGFNSFMQCQPHEIRAAVTNERALSWLRNRGERKEPFFMWVHYFDPHAPYVPPDDFKSMYYAGDPRDPGNSSMADVRYPKRWIDSPYIQWLEGVTDIQYPVSQYMGEVSYLDRHMGHLLGTLFHDGFLENTMVIFTSDHGESLHEHYIYFAHAGLYEPTTRVPLIIWYPQGLSPGIVDNLTMSVDIAPTILDFLGLDPWTGARGKSLVPFLQGRRADIHEFVFCEYWKNQLMVRDRTWKYIKSLKSNSFHEKFFVIAGKKELYALDSDPQELNDCAAQFPTVVDRLDHEAVAWLSDTRTTISSGARKRQGIREEVQEHLRALGYVD